MADNASATEPIRDRILGPHLSIMLISSQPQLDRFQLLTAITKLCHTAVADTIVVLATLALTKICVRSNTLAINLLAVSDILISLLYT
jgi:hypothetical protein